MGTSFFGSDVFELLVQEYANNKVKKTVISFTFISIQKYYIHD